VTPTAFTVSSCTAGFPVQLTAGQQINVTVPYLAQVYGGFPPYTYSWSGNCTGSARQCDKTITTCNPLAASVRVTDSKGSTGTGDCRPVITCPAGQACGADGKCACQPNCAGKTCGPDGCGGTCGVCPAKTVGSVVNGYKCNSTQNCVGPEQFSLAHAQNTYTYGEIPLVQKCNMSGVKNCAPLGTPVRDSSIYPLPNKYEYAGPLINDELSAYIDFWDLGNFETARQYDFEYTFPEAKDVSGFFIACSPYTEKPPRTRSVGKVRVYLEKADGTNATQVDSSGNIVRTDIVGDSFNFTCSQRPQVGVVNQTNYITFINPFVNVKKIRFYITWDVDQYYYYDRYSVVHGKLYHLGVNFYEPSGPGHYELNCGSRECGSINGISCGTCPSGKTCSSSGANIWKCI
jgi:hypothetical protein